MVSRKNCTDNFIITKLSTKCYREQHYKTFNRKSGSVVLITMESKLKGTPTLISCECLDMASILPILPLASASIIHCPDLIILKYQCLFLNMEKGVALLKSEQ